MGRAEKVRGYARAKQKQAASGPPKRSVCQCPRALALSHAAFAPATLTLAALAAAHTAAVAVALAHALAALNLGVPLMICTKKAWFLRGETAAPDNKLPTNVKSDTTAQAIELLTHAEGENRRAGHRVARTC